MRIKLCIIQNPMVNADVPFIPILSDIKVSVLKSRYFFNFPGNKKQVMPKHYLKVYSFDELN